MPSFALLESALAASATAGETLGGAPGPSLTRYFAACAGLLLLVAGLAWGFRKLGARVMSQRAARRSLQVIDLLPLGGKQRLVVVRCYDRNFLVGLGEREVSLVAELDPELAPQPPRPRSDVGIAPFRASSFRAVLDGALNRPHAVESPARTPSERGVLG